MSTETLERAPSTRPDASVAPAYVVAVRPIGFFRPSEEVDTAHVRQLAERHELRLGLAPAGQRRRPLLGAAEIEGQVAHLDDRAVGEPGDRR